MLSRRHALFPFVLAAAIVCCRQAGEPPHVERADAELRGGDGDDLLAHLNPTPWIDTPDTSQQYFPIFVGRTPRELVLGIGKNARTPELPVDLKDLAERQAAKLRGKLGAVGAEFQIWPTEDWGGQPAWVFARWRSNANARWEWLSGDAWTNDTNDAATPAPQLPDVRDPAKAADRHAIFDDVLDLPGLYDEPMFGNCVFADRKTGAIALKWPNVNEREARAAELSTRGKYTAYCVNQPARLNDEPLAFVLRSSARGAEWSSDVQWTPLPAAAAPAVDAPLRVTRWAADFEHRYADDLFVLAGEADAHFPTSGTTTRFLKKGAWQPDGDLETMADYLEERYAAIGVRTMRQRFMWRGLPQSNVIAVLPGSGGSDSAPVVLADHYDTANEEDTYAKTHERVPTHGCDDNVTATALLLRAAETLAAVPHRRPIWLVHLTGEEFPGDDLGAWHFLGQMLKDRQDIHAAVITDFIGWHKAGDAAYQISPTKVPGSEHVAALALDASKKIAPDIRAIYLSRNNPRNSVFQTDMQVFEYGGFPGILFNENIDYTGATDDQNPNYHQSTDVCANVVVHFASTVSKVAIETVARLAE
jgi:hypothetical protein